MIPCGIVANVLVQKLLYKRNLLVPQVKILANGLSNAIRVADDCETRQNLPIRPCMIILRIFAQHPSNKFQFL